MKNVKKKRQNVCLQFVVPEFSSTKVNFAINKDPEQAMKHEHLKTRMSISEMYPEELQTRGHISYILSSF